MTEEHELDDVDNVLLLKTGNYMLAQFLTGALDEEEIPYLAKGLGGGNRISGEARTHRGYNLPGLAEIYVNPEDYDHAKELLESLEGEDFEDFDGEDDDSDVNDDEDFFEDDDDR